MPPKTSITRELQVAEFRLNTNCIQDALDMLLPLIKENKATAEVWFLKGLCHEKQMNELNIDTAEFNSQKNLAIEAFNKALKLNPKHDKAKNSLLETQQITPRTHAPSF